MKSKYLNYLYIFVVLLALLFVSLLAFFPVISDDLFMYLALGRIFFQTGHFPNTDPFLFTNVKNAWQIMPEWGSYLTYYLVFNIGSWTGLVIFKTLLLLAMAALPLFLASRLKYKSPFIILLIMAAAMASSPRFIERSDQFSNFFAPLVLTILLWNDYSPGRFLYVLPFIFLFWVNLHPGFALGLIFTIIFLIFSLFKKNKKSRNILFGAMIGSFFACLINPQGLIGLIYPFKVFLASNTSKLPSQYYEFMPTYSRLYIHTFEVWIFLATILIGAILLYFSRKQKPWKEFLIYLLITYLGLSAIRYVPITVFSYSVLYTWLSFKNQFLPIKNLTLSKGLTIINILICLTVLNALFVFWLFFFGYTSYSGPRKVGSGINKLIYPIKAAEIIDRYNLTTPLFNQHDFGAFLAWYWNGKRKLFYHGFVDNINFYQTDYLGVNKSPEEFERIVKKYQLGAFLLANYGFDPQHLPLIYQILSTNPRWKLVYWDHLSLLFINNNPKNQAFLKGVGGY